jgi:hypothetical protein
MGEDMKQNHQTVEGSGSRTWDLRMTNGQKAVFFRFWRITSGVNTYLHISGGYSVSRLVTHTSRGLPSVMVESRQQTLQCMKRHTCKVDTSMSSHLMAV